MLLTTLRNAGYGAGGLTRTALVCGRVAAWRKLNLKLTISCSAEEALEKSWSGAEDASCRVCEDKEREPLYSALNKESKIPGQHQTRMAEIPKSGGKKSQILNYVADLELDGFKPGMLGRRMGRKIDHVRSSCACYRNFTMQYNRWFSYHQADIEAVRLLEVRGRVNEFT